MSDLDEWKAFLAKFKIPFTEQVLSAKHYHRADTRLDVEVNRDDEIADDATVQGYPGFSMSVDFRPDDGSFVKMSIWE